MHLFRLQFLQKKNKRIRRFILILQDKFDLITNLIKIKSPTWPPLLIYHGVGDMRKPHYMGVTLCTCQWKFLFREYENVTKLLCMLRAIWLAEKYFYHIINYSWHKVTNLWPLMGFPHIPHSVTSVKGSKWEICF